MHSHPSDDRLLEYAESLGGELKHYVAIEQHLCECEQCRQRIEELLCDFTLASLSLSRWTELDPLVAVDVVADLLPPHEVADQSPTQPSAQSDRGRSAARRSAFSFRSVIVGPYMNLGVLAALLLVLTANTLRHRISVDPQRADQMSLASAVMEPAEGVPLVTAEIGPDNRTPLELRIPDMASISFCTSITRTPARRLDESGRRVFQFGGEEFATTILARLDARDQMRVYQAVLAQQELYSGECDGLYGRRTAEAVIRFQQRCNGEGGESLDEDGVLGPRTVSRLVEHIPSVVLAGQSLLQ